MSQLHHLVLTRGRRLARVGLLWLAVLALPAVAQPPAPTPVTLQLGWYHQFQSAGFYVAAEKGFFAEAGLEVEIRQGGMRDGRLIAPVEEVTFQRADFGVARTDLLIHHAQGLPVVVLANIVQRSPLIFISLERHDLTRLEAIGDRPVSLTLPNGRRHSPISAETLAALTRAGVDYQALNNHTPSWQLQDLIDGTTRLMPGYSTDTPYFLERLGETVVEIHPRDYGVDAYGELLFTSQHRLSQDPDLVAAFRQAALRGWRYAMAHPEEAIAMILERYPTRSDDHDEAFLRFEAERLQLLMQPELIEIGYINRERWRSIAENYRALGLIDDYDLETFLYRPDPAPLDLSAILPWTLPGGGLLLLTLGIAGWLQTTNRRLNREILLRRHAEGALRQQAETDALTGLDNRRRFHTLFHDEILHARCHGTPLSLVIMDVDHFKQINDRHGHLAGDAVLADIARVSRTCLRGSDHFCRYGGEEFAILLPATPHAKACEVARRLLDANRSHGVVFDEQRLHYTLSLGIASLAPGDENSDDLFRRADKRLYLAKQRGRDALCCEG